jgi:hypothetical protein
LAAPNQLPDAATVTLNSTGTLDLGGFSERVNVLNLSGGRVANGTLIVGQSVVVSSPPGRIDAALDLDSAVRTFTVGSGMDATIAGPIANGGIDLRGGGRLTLTGNNTFAGGVTLAGEIALGSPTALGTGPLNILSNQSGQAKIATLAGAPRVVTNPLNVQVGFTVGGQSDLEFTSPYASTARLSCRPSGPA